MIANPLSPEEDAALRRRVRMGGAATAFAVALLLPIAGGPVWTFTLLAAITTAVASLSVVVLTGFVGQVSLCQASFIGVGAYASARLTGEAHLPFPLALILAGLAAVPVGLVAGIPALRLKGLYLAIATLGFGAAVQSSLFTNERLTGGASGVSLSRPAFLGIDFSSDRAFYYLSLIVLASLIAITVNLQRSRTGRAWAAIREADVAAAASGVSLARYKLMAFALSAFYAGIGGSLFGHAMQSVNSTSFDTFSSIILVAATVIGGVSSVAGAVLAGLFLKVMPKIAEMALHTKGNITITLLSAALLVQLATAPQGIAHEFRKAEDRIVARLTRDRRATPPPAGATTEA